MDDILVQIEILKRSLGRAQESIITLMDSHEDKDDIPSYISGTLVLLTADEVRRAYKDLYDLTHARLETEKAQKNV